MKFSRLAEYWREIEATPSRLNMTAILARLFKECLPEEIDRVVYLSLGRLRPKYEGIEFNLAEKMMLKAIAGVSGRPIGEVAHDFKIKGDLGEVIFNFQFSIFKNKHLSAIEIYDRLMELAVDAGNGSQERKIRQMAALVKDVDGPAAKYLVRIPINNLRLGFSEMTVLDGLSWMSVGDKSLRVELERAFNVSADIGLIAREFKRGGIKRIQTIQPQVGVPIRPQKSERLPSAEKIVEKLEQFAVEGKWDGLRVQIHLDKFSKSNFQFSKNTLFEEEPKSFVRIFSRNLDNMTAMFPDIVQAVDQLPVASVILDGEAVGFDPKTGKLLPFQETIQRKRIHGVGEMIKSVPLKVFVYDLLMKDGQNFIDQPFTKRRLALEQVMKGVKTGLVLAEQAVVSDVKTLRKLREKYLALGLEGVMCKKLNEPYQAGARNFNWVKFKKVTQGELADTIDAVVMGYYLGKGKRTGFGIGAFLIGLPDSSGKIGSIAKIGTGLTDDQWQEMERRGQKLKVKAKPEEYLVDKNLAPDVWMRPELVTEIMADEITKSPIHAFSLALRFPRLVRFRDDKKADEATSKSELEKLFKLQKN